MLQSEYFEKSSSYEARINRNPFWKLIKEDEVHAVLRAVLSFKNAHFLDIGAGTGFYANEIRKRGGVVTCLDSSAGMVEILKSKGFETYQVSACDFDTDRKFDYILLIGSTEFMPDLEPVLVMARSLLRPSGRIITLAPTSGLCGSIYKFVHEYFWKCPTFLHDHTSFEKHSLRILRHQKISLISQLFVLGKTHE